MNKNVTNEVTLMGKITSDFTFNHEIWGEKFYLAYITVNRLSGNADIIPVIVSENMVNVKESCADQYVRVYGHFHSRNIRKDGRMRLVLSVVVKEFEFITEDDINNENNNQIMLDGYICKKPVHRRTPLTGKDITDIFVGVNYGVGKSDYIPCICWNGTAMYANHLSVGDNVKIYGRIQSREYIKIHSETERETRVAYEVSVSKIKKAE